MHLRTYLKKKIKAFIFWVLLLKSKAYNLERPHILWTSLWFIRSKKSTNRCYQIKWISCATKCCSTGDPFQWAKHITPSPVPDCAGLGAMWSPHFSYSATSGAWVWLSRERGAFPHPARPTPPQSWRRESGLAWKSPASLTQLNPLVYNLRVKSGWEGNPNFPAYGDTCQNFLECLSVSRESGQMLQGPRGLLKHLPGVVGECKQLSLLVLFLHRGNRRLSQ